MKELWQYMYPACGRYKPRRRTLLESFRLWRRRRRIDDLAGI